MIPLVPPGQRLRELRKRAGLTGTELGGLVGVSQGTISMWETGKVPISGDAAARLADALGVEVASIMRSHSAVLTDDGLQSWREYTEGEGYGQVVDHALTVRGMTRVQLSRETGIDQGLLSNIIAGKRKATNLQRWRIEVACGAEWDWGEPVETVRTSLVRMVPARWPRCLETFLDSDEFRAMRMGPLQVSLLAAMSLHGSFWRPRNGGEWRELAELLVAKFSEVPLRLATALPAEMEEDYATWERQIEELRERAAEAAVADEDDGAGGH